MDDLIVNFKRVSHALEIDHPSIVEKDYYVVKLLEGISRIENKHLQIVFAGGTSLTKANIGIDRLSEDVDIKLIPKPGFSDLSGNQKRNVRRAIRSEILAHIASTQGLTALTDASITRDTGRYYQLPVRYENHYDVPSFLRDEILSSIIV